MTEEQAPRVPLDDVEYARWQQTAESNHRAARREADAGAHHIACTLAEQAAQCALKGLLHGLGVARDAYGHGLVRLAEHAAAQVETELDRPLRAGLQRLAQLYLPSRYPDALPEGAPPDVYASEHSAQALADAEAAMAFARDVWAAVVGSDEATRAEGP